MEDKPKIIKKIEEVFAKLPKATYDENRQNHKKSKKDNNNIIKE